LEYKWECERIAETFALGETNGCVACMFQISAAGVRQLRRELCANSHRPESNRRDEVLVSRAGSRSQ
jgi:hypothetical protein